MDQLLDRLEKQGNWRKLVRQSLKKNGMRTILANEFSLYKIRGIGARFSISFANIGDKFCTQWLQNELKAFHWVLAAVSGLSNLTVQQFKKQQWANLEEIFQHKDRTFLLYEAKKVVLGCKKKTKNWSEQQTRLLKQIIPQFKDEEGYQWNEIARKLFEMSGQSYVRTAKHCRQRWTNYLDPSKQRGQWTPEEDLQILSKVNFYGKIWASYALELNRTEHSVKNRFNSLLSKQKKLTPQIECQQRLVKLAKKSLEKSLSQTQQQAKEEENERSEEDLPAKEKQTEKEANQQPEKQNELQGNEEEAEKEPTLDVQQYVREQQQVNNFVSLTDCHPTIYSPFWSYSPNGTPNNFVNSSSPLSYYVNYNFANCFARFTNQLHNFSGAKPEENP